jgi:hypothetical protein
MEVHFTPEQQAQLDQIATKAGTVPEHLVTLSPPVISARNPASKPPWKKE